MVKDPNNVLTVLDPLGVSLHEMLTAPPPLFKPRDHHLGGGERRGKPPGARGRGTPGSSQRDSESRKISLAKRALAAAASPPAAPDNPLISTSDASPEVIEVTDGPDCLGVPDGITDVTEHESNESTGT